MTAPGAGGERASKDGGERLRAFVDIAASVGIRFPDELVAFGAHTDRGGAVAMEQLLERDLGLTAIVASNDASATGAHAVLRRRGLGVPSEVSLVGMDDRPGCVEHGLSLTTVRFPLEELGRRAGLALQSRLRGLGNTKGDRTALRVPHRWMRRPSTSRGKAQTLQLLRECPNRLVAGTIGG
jgi:LacI family transcriptional regulator